MDIFRFYLTPVHDFFQTPDHVAMGGLFVLLALYIHHLTKPKVFYVIRHGKTLLNEQHTKQGPSGFLSEDGMREAQSVGESFATLGLQVIYSSPYERAVQTANIISKIVSVPVVSNPLLAERRNPTEVIGKSTTDAEVLKITGLIENSFHDDTYRFSDEENFSDLHTRAKKCMRFLRNQSKHRVCVVTHHAFLQMFIATLLYQDTLDAQGYVKLAFYNYSGNAGVTTCIYRPLQRFSTATKGWEVVGYNQTVAG